MSVLSKTRSVLDLDVASAQSTFKVLAFRPVEAGGSRRRNVVIDHDTWRDLGSPEQITVTIEPGDTLTSVDAAPNETTTEEAQ